MQHNGKIQRDPDNACRYHSASQHKKKKKKKEPDTPIRDDDVLTVAYIPEIQAVATKKQVTKRSDGIQTNIH